MAFIKFMSYISAYLSATLLISYTSFYVSPVATFVFL